MQPSEMGSTPGVDALGVGELPRAGRRVRLSALGAVAAICLVVALFALVLHRPDGDTLGVNPTGPAAPADWQTYRDPLGLFRVRLPTEWTAQVSTGEASYGNRTGSATETTEFLNFSDPTLGDASARFDVNASPIHSEFERHWYCQAFPQKQSAFHSFPAEHFSDATWLFDTANAHFQLDVWIPGILESPHSQPHQLTPVPTATPLPPVTIAADRSVLSSILGAFQPTNATALSCP